MELSSHLGSKDAGTLCLVSWDYSHFFRISFWFWVYLDDIFILSKDTLFLEYITLSLCAHFDQAGLVLSTKSLLTPSQNLTWLGKKV